MYFTNRFPTNLFSRKSISSSIPELPKPVIRRNKFRPLRDQDEKHRNPRLYGWRATVLSCTITSTVVLIINIALTVYGVSKFGNDVGESVLHSGDCHQAKRISTILHVLINILSTTLLGASNYTMQCLHSPTRAEVDRAHTQKNGLILAFRAGGIDVS
jgi:hypothetical protein